MTTLTKSIRANEIAQRLAAVAERDEDVRRLDPDTVRQVAEAMAPAVTDALERTYRQGVRDQAGHTVNEFANLRDAFEAFGAWDTPPSWLMSLERRRKAHVAFLKLLDPRDSPTARFAAYANSLPQCYSEIERLHVERIAAGFDGRLVGHVEAGESFQAWREATATAGDLALTAPALRTAFRALAVGIDYAEESLREIIRNLSRAVREARDARRAILERAHTDDSASNDAAR
jgi:hypothetical protein